MATCGLSNAGDQSFTPGPAVATGQLTQIISQKGSGDDFALLLSFGHVCYGPSPNVPPVPSGGRGGPDVGGTPTLQGGERVGRSKINHEAPITKTFAGLVPDCTVMKL